MWKSHRFRRGDHRTLRRNFAEHVAEKTWANLTPYCTQSAMDTNLLSLLKVAFQRVTVVVGTCRSSCADARTVSCLQCLCVENTVRRTRLRSSPPLLKVDTGIFKDIRYVSHHGACQGRGQVGQLTRPDPRDLRATHDCWAVSRVRQSEP